MHDSSSLVIATTYWVKNMHNYTFVVNLQINELVPHKKKSYLWDVFSLNKIVCYFGGYLGQVSKRKLYQTTCVLQRSFENDRF